MSESSGVTRNLPPLVAEMGLLKFSGNILPRSWFQFPGLRTEAGFPNLPAILLLADLCYWYRPQEIVDEATNQVVQVKAKFKGDMLRRYYNTWGESFGLSKRQAQEAVNFLKARGFVRVDLRTIRGEGGGLQVNVVHVEPIVERIKESMDWRALTQIPDRTRALTCEEENSEDDGGEEGFRRVTNSCDTSHNDEKALESHKQLQEVSQTVVTPPTNSCDTNIENTCRRIKEEELYEHADACSSLREGEQASIQKPATRKRSPSADSIPSEPPQQASTETVAQESPPPPVAAPPLPAAAKPEKAARKAPSDKPKKINAFALFEARWNEEYPSAVLTLGTEPKVAVFNGYRLMDSIDNDKDRLMTVIDYYFGSQIDGYYRRQRHPWDLFRKQFDLLLAKAEKAEESVYARARRTPGKGNDNPVRKPRPGEAGYSIFDDPENYPELQPPVWRDGVPHPYTAPDVLSPPGV
jgi:hypothetical protein